MSVRALFLILSLSVASIGCTADDTNSMPQQKGKTMLTTQDHVAASVELIKKGRRSNFEETAGLKIIEEIPAILDSCRDRDKRRADDSLWEKLMKSGTCIHVHYDGPQSFQLTVCPELTVTELLIPLDQKAWRGKILTRNGDTYYSPFTACDSNRLDALSAFF